MAKKSKKSVKSKTTTTKKTYIDSRLTETDYTYRKDYTRLTISKFVPPNYNIGYLVAMKNGADAYRITFAISPSSIQESRSNVFQTTRTNGGWFAMRMGAQPIGLSWSGYMLDIEGYLEKHKFLENWKAFIEDKQNSSLEFSNDYTMKFICMGRTYYGIINSINFSADGQRPLIQSYSISMTCFDDKYSYDTNINKAIVVGSDKSDSDTSVITISKKIKDMLF